MSELSVTSWPNRSTEEIAGERGIARGVTLTLLEAKGNRNRVKYCSLFGMECVTLTKLSQRVSEQRASITLCDSD
ncbi:MAG: hypothetical protein RIS43_516 [Actinomycetota bacterium]